MIISRIKCFNKGSSCLCACIDLKEHEVLCKGSDKRSDKSKSDKVILIHIFKMN